MFFTENFYIFSVGIAIAATCLLGFVVYFNNRASLTNQSFLAFTLTTAIWGLINYINYQPHSPLLSLWIARLLIYFASWQAFYLFLFFFAFPESRPKLPTYFQTLLLPTAVLNSFLTLTPLVFHKITAFDPQGRIMQISNGPGIVIFGLVNVGFVAAGLILLLKKFFYSQQQEKQPLLIILAGTLITFILIIVFNFIFPAFLNNASLMPLGATFTFPFVALTSYAVFKHKFLNVKILSTEILTFVLTVTILLETLLSDNPIIMLFRFSMFLLILSIGILLTKSVIREVQQREQMEILSKQLAEANQQLTALDKARAEFISIVSHQLRTPPTTVKWYLSSILDGDYGKLSKTLKEALIKTECSNNLLISLIEDILNVSRIERGTLEFLFEKTDILQITQLTVEQLKPLAKAKGLQIKFIAPTEPLPTINADKEKLRQVINNLIDNAIKYTAKGTVEVSLFKENDQIRFQVKDTGQGINPDELKNIFEKYSRGKKSINQNAGLGLGLYIAKIIISQHQGKIWAESAGQDQGSTFIFTIPIHTNTSQISSVDLKTIDQTTQTSPG